jgi:DnaJ homolog subfamily C member 9
MIYETVMLSDPLEDEGRFRGIIDEGIEKGEVKAYKAYTKETTQAKNARMRDAKKEGKEAMAYAEELGVADKLFGKKDGTKGGKKDNRKAGLAALIKSRQDDRGSFFDHLEAKYAGPGKNSKGKKRGSEEDQEMPSEEAFQAAAARLKNGKAGEERKANKKFRLTP